MPAISNKENERRVLSLMMHAPTHTRAPSIDLDLFAYTAHRRAAQLIRDFVIKFRSPPSKKALERYVDSLNIIDVDESERVIDALKAVRDLPRVSPATAEFEFAEAYRYRVGRALFDASEEMRKEFEIGNPDFDSIARKVINKLLLTSPNSGEISRASLADPKKIVERYRVYKDAEDGNTGDIIPFGIKPLDDTLGGMRKTFVTLFYSKTGGGKTRISLNIALNAALRGFRVMYISLEMSFNLLASCFDARLAWVDSKKIIFGKLDKNDKVKYKKSLKKLIQKNLNIWIVDVPQGINSAGIQNEIQLYRGRHGVDPDLVIVDYANLMEPNQRYMGRSEKYDYLFKELHEIAKAENVAILTATQESREASKGDIAKRNGEEREEGVHNIGLSNYMAPHCESVVRLKQSNTDKLQNRLVGIIDKSRYGANGIEVFMIAIWDRNYVGDENVIGLKVANPGTALRTRAPVTRVRKNTKLPKEVGYLLDLYENETVELLAA